MNNLYWQKPYSIFCNIYLKCTNIHTNHTFTKINPIKIHTFAIIITLHHKNLHIIVYQYSYSEHHAMRCISGMSHTNAIQL